MITNQYEVEKWIIGCGITFIVMLFIFGLIITGLERKHRKDCEDKGGEFYHRQCHL